MRICDRYSRLERKPAFARHGVGLLFSRSNKRWGCTRTQRNAGLEDCDKAVGVARNFNCALSGGWLVSAPGRIQGTLRFLSREEARSFAQLKRAVPLLRGKWESCGISIDKWHNGDTEFSSLPRRYLEMHRQLFRVYRRSTGDLDVSEYHIELSSHSRYRKLKEVHWLGHVKRCDFYKI